MIFAEIIKMDDFEKPNLISHPESVIIYCKPK